VRELREAAGLSQEELGRRARLTPKAISMIENARTNASIGVVSRLAAGLQLPTSALFVEGAPGAVIDDAAAATALIAAQPPEARRQALRVLRALFEP
jgi:transcriptional regulator with XRE-family HTH domain